MDEDDNGKFRLERVNPLPAKLSCLDFFSLNVLSRGTSRDSNLLILFNPLTAKLFNLNLEVVSR